MFALMIAFTAISVLVIIFTIYIILRPMLFGAIYFPTMPGNVEVIRKFAAVKPGEKIADLGSGDGRILIALAKEGAETHGYEVNPLLVMSSRRNIRKAGLSKKAFVHLQSFWKADLSRYDAVITYGFPHIMKKLGEKLKRELRPKAKIISNIFLFPNLKEIRTENKVRLYEIS